MASWLEQNDALLTQNTDTSWLDQNDSLMQQGISQDSSWLDQNDSLLANSAQPSFVSQESDPLITQMEQSGGFENTPTLQAGLGHVVGKVGAGFGGVVGAGLRGAGGLADTLSDITGGDPKQEQQLVTLPSGKQEVLSRPMRDFNPLSSLGKTVGGISQALEKSTNEQELQDSFLATDLPAGLGSLAAFLATGGTAGAATLGALSGGQSLKEEAEAKGASEDDQKLMAAIGGALGITEAILPTRLFKSLDKLTPGFKQQIVKSLESATLEGGQEVLQNVLSTASLNQVVKPEFQEELFDEGTIREGGAGAILGGLLDLAFRGKGGRSQSFTTETSQDVRPTEVLQPETVSSIVDDTGGAPGDIDVVSDGTVPGPEAVAEGPATADPIDFDSIDPGSISDLDQARSVIEQLQGRRQELEQQRVTAAVGGGQTFAGVKNMQAFKDAEQEGSLGEAIGFFDMDNLKTINDEMGHQAGDDAILAIGNAVRNTLGRDGNVYHRGGDEFVIDAQSPQAIERALNSVREEAKTWTFEGETESGEKISRTGLAFSFGVGSTVQDAENAQTRDKQARLEAGLRTERRQGPESRRQEPVGLSEENQTGNPEDLRQTGQPDRRRGVESAGEVLTEQPQRTDDQQQIREEAPGEIPRTQEQVSQAARPTEEARIRLDADKAIQAPSKPLQGTSKVQAKASQLKAEKVQQRTSGTSLKRAVSRALSFRKGATPEIYDAMFEFRGDKAEAGLRSERRSTKTARLQKEKKVPDDVLNTYIESGGKTGGKVIPTDLRMNLAAQIAEKNLGEKALIDRGILKKGKGKKTDDQGRILNAMDDETLENYLRREYQIFSHRGDWVNHLKKHDPERLAEFKQWAATEKGRTYLGIKPNETVDAVVKDFSQKHQRVFGASGGKDITRGDVSALLHRKDIPTEVRNFWGENKDPSSRLSRSLLAQELLKKQDQFYRKLSTIGLEQGWMVKGRQQEGWFALSDRNVKEVGHPLHDIYVHPQIFRAIKDPDGRVQLGFDKNKKDERLETAVTRISNNPLVSFPSDIVGWAKGMMVIWNPGSIIKNSVSAPMFYMGGGGVNPLHLTKAINTTFQQLKHIRNKTLSPEQFAKVEEITRNRLVDESALGEEAFQNISPFLDRIAPDTKPTTLMQKIRKSALRGSNEMMREIFSFADTVGRVAVYNRELAVLKTAKPDGNIRDLELEAAARARATYPTYSNVPLTVRAMQNKPLGTFLSYNVEVARTFVNNLKLATEDMTSGNMRLAAHGVQRFFATNAVYGTVGAGIGVASLAALDFVGTMLGFPPDEEWDEKEDEAWDAMRPEWAQGDLHYVFKDSAGERKEFNVSNWNAMSVTESFFRSVLEDPSPEGFKKGIEEYISPFVDLSLGVQYGQAIAEADGKKLRSLLLPALVDKSIKIVEADTPEDKQAALQAMFSMKPTEINADKAVGFKLQESFEERDKRSGKLFRELRSKDSREEFKEVFDEYYAWEKDEMSKFSAMADNLKELDMSRREIMTALKQSRNKTKFSQATVNALMRGRYVPRDFNLNSLRDDVDRSTLLEMTRAMRQAQRGAR